MNRRRSARQSLAFFWSRATLSSLAALMLAALLMPAFVFAASDVKGNDGDRDTDGRRPAAAPNGKPAVVLIAPVDGASFPLSAAVTLTAIATDGDGRIRFVRFLDGDDEIAHVDAVAPYTVIWRHPRLGRHVLSAVATDNKGATTKSAPVTITIVDSAPRVTVNLTAPASGTVLVAPADITVRADASASSGTITEVEFFSGAVSIGRATAAPYAVLWPGVGSGTYKLTARATTAAGLTGDSPVVPVIVDALPTVSLAASAPSVLTGAVVTLTATPADSDGSVASVAFFNGATLIGTSTGPSFATTWSSAAAGAFTFTAVATDNFGFASPVSNAVAVNVTPPPPPTNGVDTPAGGNEVIETAATLPDGTTRSVSVAFGDVNAPGQTRVTAAATGSPLPAGYDGGAAPIFYDVTTTAQFTGPASLCFTWHTGDVPNDSNARLLHQDGGLWKDVTVSVDVNGKVACGEVTTLSPFTIAAGTASTPTTTAPLVDATSFEYLGAFRVPQLGSDILASFEYGGTALGFNPARNSLFIVGHDQGQRVAEIGIPEVLKGSTPTLNTASLLQPFADVTDGRMELVNPDSGNQKKIGGLFPYQNKLFATVFDFYDGGSTQQTSHFVSPLEMAAGAATGPFKATFCSPIDPTDCLQAGYFSGYFGVVPAAWQAAFGGPVLNGQCCLNVIGRTSWGPAAFAMNPIDVLKIDPATAQPLPARETPLVYYWQQHPLLEDQPRPGLVPYTVDGAVIDDGCHNTSLLFNCTSEVKAVVMPPGTRSVLFFGRQGTGPFCYGQGTSDQALNGTAVDPINEPDVIYCYDPSDSSKGTHAYPYEYHVWGYDANQLAQVAGGAIAPWDVKPYAVWPIDLTSAGSDPTLDQRIGGTAYDPQTGRFYISQMFGDGLQPLIHVFKLQLP